MIQLRKAGFRYPDAVDAAFELETLTVERGGCVGIVGNSGAGKSTLLRMLAGVAPAMTGGTAWGSGAIAGRALPITHGDLADLVGCVQQDPAAGVVCERVEDEIAFTVENLGIEPLEIRRRVETLLDRFDLHALRRRRIATLSGGERQKMQLAAALIAGPTVLLLDEPTSQLDAHGIDTLLGILVDLRRDARTMLIVEQRPDRLRSALDQVVRIGVDHSPAIPAPIRERRSPGDLLVAVDGLSVELDSLPILSNVTFELHAGEAVALTGPNGSGKTTLLRALLGFAPCSAGRIRELPPRDAISYVPQRPEAAFCRDRVRDEVALTMRARKIATSLDAMLDALGLQDLADRSPRHLSAGQRLRVALGALTLGHPRLVLLDEPTRGLDADARVALLSAIERWSAAGAVTLIATHDAELIAACDRRIGLERGALVDDARAEARR